MGLLDKLLGGNKKKQKQAEINGVTNHLNQLVAMKAKKKICFDTETTGTSEKRDEILQLSIVDQDGNVLFNKYFKPLHRKTWASAEAVNGISPAMVKDCGSIEDDFQEIQAIIDSAELYVGYNIEFDTKFMEAAGFKFKSSVPGVDVMLDFAQIKGDWIESKQDYKWHKLTVCAKYYGYKWPGKAHDSVEDAKATIFCFNKMLDQRIEAIQKRLEDLQK